MIVIDTNVLSELMKPLPSTQVVRWMNGWPVSRLLTTTITMARCFTALRYFQPGSVGWGCIITDFEDCGLQLIDPWA